MKAFLLSVVVLVILTASVGMLLAPSLNTPADQAFATQGARVSEGGSVKARDFSGVPRTGS